MVNKVTLIGNLGGDPELKNLESGVSVCKFSLATTESYKDKNGDWQNLTEWHNIICWREQAESAAKNLAKGEQCYVEGKISSRKYTDKDGVERTAFDIVASNFRRLTKREKSGESQSFPTDERAAKPSKSDEYLGRQSAQKPVETNIRPSENANRMDGQPAPAFDEKHELPF